MSEDFYRTMFTDEEKKKAIYGCPKSSKVCYNPPPINEAAPGSVKKAEAAFNSIQSNPNLTLDDLVVDVLNTIRCIMENAASMATQARLDNLYSGMLFTGKPEQVVESEVKPLIDSEKFETQLAEIKPTKRVRKLQQHDRLRIPPVGGFRGEPGAEVEGASNGFNHSPGGREPLGVQISLGKARGQSVGPENRLPGEPKKSFCSSGPLAWPSATQGWPASTKLNERFDEESAASPKSDTEGASTTDNASYAIQAEARPRGPPNSDGKGSGSINEEGHRGVRILIHRSVVSTCVSVGTEEATSFVFYHLGHGLESSSDKDPRPTARSRETDKRRQDDAQRPRELYRKGTSDVSGAPTGKINDVPTSGAKEPILVEEHVMDIDGLSIRRSNTDSTVLEGPFEEMEWSFVPARNPRSRVIHRCERYDLGHRHWTQKLLWLMEKIRGYTPHQLQGAACSSICLATERNRGPVNSDLIRKYDHPSISKEIWWNYLTRTSQHSGTPVGALPEDEYLASSHVCSVSCEPSGCTELLNRTDRLVPGTTICRPERAAIQLVELEEPVILPTLEPDFTGSPEDETRVDYDESNYACMDISDLVSRHSNTIDFPNTNSMSNRGGPRPDKRKVPTHQEQGLDSNGVENQRSALKEKGVSNAAIELILNSQRSVRR
ncbi:hypothetical protein AYI69_g2553 [Smittium culicis]|nr:hypothetical protein AYI69_g2553 [Smittium culicis]